MKTLFIFLFGISNAYGDISTLRTCLLANGESQTRLGSYACALSSIPTTKTNCRDEFAKTLRANKVEEDEIPDGTAYACSGNNTAAKATACFKLVNDHNSDMTYLGAANSCRGGADGVQVNKCLDILNKRDRNFEKRFGLNATRKWGAAKTELCGG